MGVGDLNEQNVATLITKTLVETMSQFAPGKVLKGFTVNQEVVKNKIRINLKIETKSKENKGNAKVFSQKFEDTRFGRALTRRAPFREISTANTQEETRKEVKKTFRELFPRRHQLSTSQTNSGKTNIECKLFKEFSSL